MVVTKLEIQYAVRVAQGPGTWHYSPPYYRREHAERSRWMRDAGAEVVAQVVMVAVPWTTPEQAEAAVHEQWVREHRNETIPTLR
jgi:hypothetical protein